MSWVYIENLKKYINENVEIKGWLYNKRSSGKIHFLQIRDGTGFVQGVLEKSKVDGEIFENAKRVRLESSIIVQGKVREDPRAPSGVEIEVSNLKIVQVPIEDYPIGKKEHGIDFLMDHRHLWLRSKKQFHILRIRHEIVKAIQAASR